MEGTYEGQILPQWSFGLDLWDYVRMFPSGVAIMLSLRLSLKLLKGIGNHKPIFGLQVLAYLQSERALYLWFSFVEDDIRLDIEFKGFCSCFGGKEDTFKQRGNA